MKSELSAAVLVLAIVAGAFTAARSAGGESHARLAAQVASESSDCTEGCRDCGESCGECGAECTGCIGGCLDSIGPYLEGCAESCSAWFKGCASGCGLDEGCDG